MKRNIDNLREKPLSTAAEKEWSEIKANIYRRQASLQNPSFGEALPPLFPDYLQTESLAPIYYQTSPQSAPILHYWELRLQPRFANPLYQKSPKHALYFFLNLYQ